MRNNTPLKIGYFADGIWSHNAFKKIISDDNFEICFITPRFDSVDQTLENFAKTHKIPYVKSKNINSLEFIECVRKFECDIFVSMSFNQIFKNEIINLPPLKTINCHAGKLPFYRGRNILNWALINDEKEFGITVHYVDDGIDTGDIILQETYPIRRKDTYATLLQVAHTECANVLYQALVDIKNGSAKRVPQNTINPYGFYCSERKNGDEIIDWNQNSLDVYNFIRAICPPAIGARSYVASKMIQINRAVLIDNAPNYKCKNGAVVGINTDGFFVKTNDSVLFVSDYVFDRKIKIGDFLSKEPILSLGGGGASN